MKLIFTTEYSIIEVVVRVLAQIDIEKAIISENTSRVQLTCSSFIFYQNKILKIGSYS